MAYKNDFSLGFKYCMNRNAGFFRRLGITSDYRFAHVYEPLHVKYFINMYETFLNFNSSNQESSHETAIRNEIENLKHIRLIQTSKEVMKKNPGTIPFHLSNFGLDWHWWSENPGSNECVTIPDITGICVQRNCLQILNDDSISTLLAYISMFQDTFLSRRYGFAHLKTLIDDINYIISIKEILQNKDLFIKQRSKGVLSVYW